MTTQGITTNQPTQSLVFAVNRTAEESNTRSSDSVQPATPAEKADGDAPRASQGSQNASQTEGKNLDLLG